MVKTGVGRIALAEVVAAMQACGSSSPAATAGISGTQTACVALGGVTAAANATTPNFRLNNVATGIQDLVGYRVAGMTATAGDQVIIHRDLNIADGGSTGVVDFSAAEAVAPASASITITSDVGNNPYSETLNYRTGTSCSVGALNFSIGNVPSPITIYGVPASLQRATDFHQLQLPQVISSADFREVLTSFHTVADKTVSIGAAVGPVTVTTLPAPTSAIRLRSRSRRTIRPPPSRPLVCRHPTIMRS